MSDRRDYYDSNGNFLGHSNSGNTSCDPEFMGLLALGFLGLIAIVVGIFGGVGAMLTFVFWTGLIVGGFYLVFYFVLDVVFFLNKLFNEITDDHAGIIWIAIAVLLVIIGVSACHNWLISLVPGWS